jgi:RND family efflux transporter MFP subunit
MTPRATALDALRIDRTAAPRRRAPIALALVLLLLIGAAALVAWWRLGPRGARAVVTVLVQAPVAGEARTILNASGYVTARREATVSSKFTGKVQEVLVEEGMRVEADQVLARLDATNDQTSLDLAEARVEAARMTLDETQANLGQAEREMQRLTRMVADRAASELELERAQTTVEALRARLARQQADVTVAERELAVWIQQLEDSVIRAPFAGVVTSKNAQPGEMISPISAGGGFTRTGICTIVDMSSLEIEVDVNESYINRVEPLQPVQATLDSYPSWRIPARVIAIIPTADRQKATVKVRVAFDGLDPRILPDMSVKVAFRSAAAAEGEAGPRPRLPRSALRRDGGQDIVWVVRDGRLERRAVTVAGAEGDELAIAAGVSPGERVVVEGPPDLAQGQAVTEGDR